MALVTRLSTELILFRPTSSEDAECGQGMVEYAILITLISVAVVILMTQIGQSLVPMFQGAENAL